jgi:hypothetical protein
MSTSQQGYYVYESLPYDDVFRFLVLEPGTESDPLLCRLQIGWIADTTYEAISYVWGTPIRDQPIFCDGCRMMITPNLDRALRSVRLPDKPRTLWADSICINQENNDEKGHQVGLMGKIYHSAKRVIIYVGPDEDNYGPALVSLLDDVDQMISDTCKTIDMSSRDSYPYLEENAPILHDPRWNSLSIFVKQDWFTRGWVIQEAALANQHEIIWGQCRPNWEKLMRVYLWLMTRGLSIYRRISSFGILNHLHVESYEESHKDFAQIWYPRSSRASASLLKTLNQAKKLALNDQHDRIYAFMDLPQIKQRQIKIQPDYSTFYLKTYQRFASDYVQMTGSTKILHYVSHDSDSLAVDVPSWIPRWDITTVSLASRMQLSSVLLSRTLATPKPFVTQAGSLKVCGVILDTVQYVSHVLYHDTTTPEAIKKIWETIQAANIKSPYTASEPDSTNYLLVAFLDALTCSRYYGGEYHHWQRSRERFVLKAKLQQERNKVYEETGDCDSEAFDAPQSTNIYYNHMRRMTTTSRFIFTSRGYMGLAPGPTRVGDSCAIVFGTKMPCILRNTEKDSTYLCVGATALLGKQCYDTEGGGVNFLKFLGDEESKDWVEWDVEEQDIYLC